MSILNIDEQVFAWGPLFCRFISEPALELHSRAALSVRGITAQLVLTQGEIQEEGRTEKKIITQMQNLASNVFFFVLMFATYLRWIF